MSKTGFIIEVSESRRGPWARHYEDPDGFLEYDTAGAALGDAECLHRTGYGICRWIRIRRADSVRAVYVLQPVVKAVSAIGLIGGQRA